MGLGKKRRKKFLQGDVGKVKEIMGQGREFKGKNQDNETRRKSKN